MHWTKLSAKEQSRLVMRLYNYIMTKNTSVYTRYGVSERIWTSPETGMKKKAWCNAQNERSQTHCKELLGGFFKKNPKWYVENMPDDLCKEIFRSSYADCLVEQQKARGYVNDLAQELRTRLQKKEKGFWSIFVEHPDHTFVGKVALWCLLRPFA
jgi:hypothetical protein